MNEKEKLIKHFIRERVITLIIAVSLGFVLVSIMFVYETFMSFKVLIAGLWSVGTTWLLANMNNRLIVILETDVEEND
jgi:ABC-type bacteriocin/lantibiotic exporter with double-glycine peptidase domain